MSDKAIQPEDQERDDRSLLSASPALTEVPTRRRRRVESFASAALAGVVYAVLAIIALVLLSGYPDLDLSQAELSAWFDEGSNQARLLTGLNLVAISSIAFLWFVAVIRRRIGEHEDQFFGTVFFGSAIAFTVVWMIAGAALAAPAIATTMLGAASVSGDSASLAAGLGWALLLVVAPRLQAVFVITTSTVIMRSKILPRWLAIFGYIVGIGMFMMPLVFTSFGVAFPVWVLVVSIAVLTARR
jgi:hypothetical protein